MTCPFKTHETWQEMGGTPRPILRSQGLSKRHCSSPSAAAPSRSPHTRKPSRFAPLPEAFPKEHPSCCKAFARCPRTASVRGRSPSEVPWPPHQWQRPPAREEGGVPGRPHGLSTPLHPLPTSTKPHGRVHKVTARAATRDTMRKKKKKERGPGSDTNS